MSTDRELEDVIRELSKLKGETLCTYPQGKPNEIVGITPEGFVVRTEASKRKNKDGMVKWDWVIHTYKMVRTMGDIFQGGRASHFHHRGAFIRPLLAELTTVEHIEGASPPGIRYLADGLPVRLRNPRDKVAGDMADKRKLTVIIEQDKDGYYVASVPALRGCHTQGKSLDEIMERIQEAARLCLEVEGEDASLGLKFVGVQAIEV